MIDMGVVKGERVFYTGGRSIRELMIAGELIAIPDAETGVVFKRIERATEVERMAALTIEEVVEIERKRNG